jgi:hypothetical protein
MPPTQEVPPTKATAPEAPPQSQTQPAPNTPPPSNKPNIAEVYAKTPSPPADEITESPESHQIYVHTEKYGDQITSQTGYKATQALNNIRRKRR